MSEKFPNFCSFSGNAAGQLAFQRTPDAVPVELRASGDALVEIDEVLVNVPRGLHVADALKFSCARHLHIRRVVVRSEGEIHENALDANNECRHLRIDEVVLQEGRQNALTVKGGCEAMDFGLLRITGAGGHCDAEFGNYSEQSARRSRDIRLGAVECDGGARAFRYRVAWAEDVRIEHGRRDYQFWPSLGVKLYCAALYRKLP